MMYKYTKAFIVFYAFVYEVCIVNFAFRQMMKEIKRRSTEEPYCMWDHKLLGNAFVS